MIEIARAGEEDAPVLAALGAGALREAWSEGAFREELRRSDARVWVARRYRHTVGYAAVRRLDDELEVLSIAVRRDRRRQGVGRALLERALAAEPGVTRVHLEVREDDPGARAFYARLGFEPVGRRARFYGDGCAALLMTREVPPEAPGRSPPERGAPGPEARTAGGLPKI